MTTEELVQLVDAKVETLQTQRAKEAWQVCRAELLKENEQPKKLKRGVTRSRWYIGLAGNPCQSDESANCPGCSADLRAYSGIKPGKCPHCGQKLDWKE